LFQILLPSFIYHLSQPSMLPANATQTRFRPVYRLLGGLDQTTPATI
jgi:hypothetical protein